MKKIYLLSLIIVLVLTLLACQKNEVLSNEAESKKSTENFFEPNPTDWAQYTKPLKEYMYYRTQAVINDDIYILWKRYPKLKDNVNLQKGINTEENEVKTLNQDFTLIEASYDIESYEKIKVKKKNENEVVVLLHGSISYLREDFEDSGGEYLVEIYLEKMDNKWSVVKTDEYTLPEYKAWLEKTNP